jgi:hypothetical protein
MEAIMKAAVVAVAGWSASLSPLFQQAGFYIGTAMTIVTYAHRPPRPPRRKKAQPAAITKIVTSISRKQARLAAYARTNRPPDATSE